MRRIPWIVAAVITISLSCGANENGKSKPIATVFGKQIFDTHLEPSAKEKQVYRKQFTPKQYQDWLTGDKPERLRSLVWNAVFQEYAKQRQLAPTAQEIESYIKKQELLLNEAVSEREQQRQKLLTELKSPNVSEDYRRNAQPLLNSLNDLKNYNDQRLKDLQDPIKKKALKEAERETAKWWLQNWKINQALHKEFGGRIIFQQAGWEPIDAYRKILEKYENEKKWIVYDAALRQAVYNYFEHKFVYLDEKKAKFYFEKPYWERTKEEMQAAGF